MASSRSLNRSLFSSSSYDVQLLRNDLASHLPFVREIFLEGKFKKRNAPDEDVQTGPDAKNSKFIIDGEGGMDGGVGGGESDGSDEEPELLDSVCAICDNGGELLQDVQTGPDATNSKFIIDGEGGMDGGVGGGESDEEPELLDSVCAICDNGGELLCCQGRCCRSFHATRADGADSDCKSLGYTKAEVKEIKMFVCANCKLQQHQCFACGKLGTSNTYSGAEVFPCASTTCRHFYHPECVAKLLYPGNDAEAEEHQENIAAGISFTCPVHKCLVCKQVEDMENEELQFAMCRRCPRAYHRKCLPRSIAFEDDSEEGIQQRAWEDLIPNRIMIYCLKHRIDEELGTPTRNHIKFPESAQRNLAGIGLFPLA